MNNEFVTVVDKNGIERIISKMALNLLKDAHGNLPAGMDVVKTKAEIVRENENVEGEIKKFIQRKAVVKTPATPVTPVIEPLKVSMPEAVKKPEAKPTVVNTPETVVKTPATRSRAKSGTRSRTKKS